MPPTRRPRAHHRVNPYLGARRQSETKMFSDHDETSPSIAAVSAPSVACSTLAVQQHCPRQQPITKHVRAATDNLSQSPTPVKFKHVRQDAQLSQRDRAAGCVIVFAESRQLELGDNILRTV